LVTFDVGPLFFHLVSLEPAPLVHFGQSQEITRPYRSSPVVIFRLFPFHVGLVMGWWRNGGLTEEQALSKAMQAYGIELFSGDIDDPEVRASIRENIAKATHTVEDEWLIVEALGLHK